MAPPLRITFFIRKEHFVFTGNQGLFNLQNIYKSYLAFKQRATECGNPCPTNFPIYTPHPIGFKTTYLKPKVEYGNIVDKRTSFVNNNIQIESALAVKIEPLINCETTKQTTLYNHNHNNIGSINTSSFANLQLDYSPYLYRGFINTHIICPDVHKKELCFFMYGKNGRFLPSNRIVDYIDIRDHYGAKFSDIKFDVEMASDSELGIDEEWEKIVKWASYKM